MTALVTSGLGFLLAVLWFDLMFDVQVRRHRAEAVPADVLASISAYYGRVTTAARPMNRLIAAVMVITLAALVAQIADGDSPRWASGASLALAGVCVLLAALHTVPRAVRLGTRREAPGVQGTLARAILRDHLVCLAAITAALVLQLAVVNA